MSDHHNSSLILPKMINWDVAAMKMPTEMCFVKTSYPIKKKTVHIFDIAMGRSLKDSQMSAKKIMIVNVRVNFITRFGIANPGSYAERTISAELDRTWNISTENIYRKRYNSSALKYLLKRNNEVFTI